MEEVKDVVNSNVVSYDTLVNLKNYKEVAYGDNLICKLLYAAKEDLMQDKKTGIYIPKDYILKQAGEKHTIVSDYGKVHYGLVLSIGHRVQGDIQIGDVVRIIPTLPEHLVDPMSAELLEVNPEDVAIVSMTLVRTVFRNTEIQLETVMSIC